MQVSRLYMYTYINLYMYIYICIYICIYTWIYTWIHIYSDQQQFERHEKTSPEQNAEPWTQSGIPRASLIPHGEPPWRPPELHGNSRQPKWSPGKLQKPPGELSEAS